MTFRSSKPFVTEGNHACVPIESGTFVQWFKAENSSNTPDDQVLLTANTQIDFWGHNADGTGPSNRGVRVLITSECGGHNVLGASIYEESNSEFYKFNDKSVLDEDLKTFRRRFKDSTCTTLPPTQDQDTCDHLSIVDVYDLTNGAPVRKGGPWSCTNGECRVEIGGRVL